MDQVVQPNEKKPAGQTLVALAFHDPLNSKKTPVFATFSEQDTTYFVVDPKNFDGPRLYDYLKRFAAANKKDLTINVDSFIQIYAAENNNPHLKTSIIHILVLALRFYQKKPFTMKKGDDGLKYKLNYLIDPEHKAIFEEACVISNAQFFCRKLQDMPSNLLDPAGVVTAFQKVFSAVSDKVQIRVLNQADLVAEKMNLLLGVNKGSSKEARLLCVEYLNNPESKEKYGYVGKGITFDSGGMNIKTMQHMRWMKFDMSGAATVLSTVYALAKNNVKTNVVAIAALTENAIGPNALRPDDILVSHSGQTVEIDNTDAEGRLVLADALSYAQKHYGVTKLVDVATLTGAMIIALGDVYTGVWATHDADWQTFADVAHWAGEYVWRLPFHENFTKLLDSTIADVKNAVSDLRAGSSRAAGFLKKFVSDEISYIHLDVAITTDVQNMGHAAMLHSLYEFAKLQK